MKQLVAFTRKEFIELIRTGKIYILLVLFILFGIMGPALAKLTPWMMDIMSDSLAKSGFSVSKIDVTAMTSWEQYYKNMSMEFVAVILLFGGILTSEFQKGTLVNMLTKGLSRWKVLASKGIMVFVSYTVCYFMSYGITYAYNMYYWDNSVASHVFLGAVYSYLFGLFLLALIFAFSVFMNSGIIVILGVGVIYVIMTILSMIQPVAEYLPVKLGEGVSLLSGQTVPGDFIKCILVTIVLSIICGIISVIGMNRRRV